MEIDDNIPIPKAIQKAEVILRMRRESRGRVICVTKMADAALKAHDFQRLGEASWGESRDPLPAD